VGEFLTAALGAWAETVLEAMATVGAHKPADPPSHHLVYIAVEPGSRGSGICAALIEPLLGECDQRRVHG
jgi:hypothetical protein